MTEEEVTNAVRDAIAKMLKENPDIDMMFSAENMGFIIAASQQPDLEKKYDQAASKYLELAEKNLELANKYAAALGKIAELEEMLRIERSKNRNMVERW